MFSIAVLLFASPGYSASGAALGTGAMPLTSAISVPLRGGLVDRGRRGPALGRCLAGCLAGMTGLVLVVLLGSRGRAIVGSSAVRDADGRWQRIPAGLYWILAAQLLFCCALGALEIALPIQTRAHGKNAWSVFCPAALSIAGIVAAMGSGAPTPAILGRITTPWLLAAFLVGTAVVATAMSWSPLAALVCPLAGAAIGAIFSALFLAVGATRTDRTRQRDPESGHERRPRRLRRRDILRRVDRRRTGPTCSPCR
ncbi:hypothetical protein ACFVW1_33785 [Streptomyces olivochromogenes]|uniref:hypothetical protein n=1 Tax=Streptomyces olivochromogenes TaxID=1963 RepID=UPI0036D9BF17